VSPDESVRAVRSMQDKDTGAPTRIFSVYHGCEKGDGFPTLEKEARPTTLLTIRDSGARQAILRFLRLLR